jgi:hypothetical protein
LEQADVRLLFANLVALLLAVSAARAEPPAPAQLTDTITVGKKATLQDLLETLRKHAHDRGAAGLCRFAPGQTVPGAIMVKLVVGTTSLSGPLACEDVKMLDRIIDGRAVGTVSLMPYQTLATLNAWIDARRSYYGPVGAGYLRDEFQLWPVDGPALQWLVEFNRDRPQDGFWTLEMEVTPQDEDPVDLALSPHEAVIAAAPAPSPGPKASLSIQQVTQVVNARRAGLLRCFGKDKKPGNLTLEWSFDWTGRVDYMKVLTSTLHDPVGERCVVETIRNLRFPAGPARVALPLLFDK